MDFMIPINRKEPPSIPVPPIAPPSFPVPPIAPPSFPVPPIAPPSCPVPTPPSNPHPGCCMSALAMAYVPVQQWRNLYEPDVALSRATLFAELDKPFIGEGVRSK